MSRGKRTLSGVRSGRTRVTRVRERVCPDWGKKTPRGAGIAGLSGNLERAWDSGSRESPRASLGQRV